MKKWKAILFGTMLTLSLCTFTACGTEVNNADETVDEKNKDEKDKKKDTNEKDSYYLDSFNGDAEKEHSRNRNTVNGKVDGYGFFPFNQYAGDHVIKYNYGYGAKLQFDFTLTEDGQIVVGHDDNGPSPSGSSSPAMMMCGCSLMTSWCWMSAVPMQKRKVCWSLARTRAATTPLHPTSATSKPATTIIIPS